MAATTTRTSQFTLTADDLAANWSAIALDLIRLVRSLKAEYVAAAELLQITLGLLGTADRDRDLARKNSAARAEDNRRLHAEIRMLRAEIARLERLAVPVSCLGTPSATEGRVQ
jgi:hypothetical protein